jgi:phage antirepressor YoqD-like protein
LEDSILNRSKLFAAAALLLSALLLGGCATALIGPGKTADTTSASATASVDASTVLVAEVNGVGIYKDAYDNLMYQKYMNGEDFSTEEASALRSQEALDKLINTEVRKQKMAELGYTALTDAEIAEAEADMKKYLLEYIEYSYMEDVIATLEKGYTKEELEAAKVDYIDTLLENSGVAKSDFLKVFTDRVANEKAVEATQGEIAPTDAEVQAKYDEYVAEDKTAIQDDPLSYIGSMNGGVTVYYAPSGVRRVRQVLIIMDDETIGAISLLRSNAYDEAADTLLEGGLADIEEKAGEVLGKLQSGELTFDQAIEQYNDDTGMPDEGYPVMHNTSAYMTEFTEAAMGLTAVGSFTELVATDYGYHIIEYYTDEPSGAISIDLVRDDIYDELHDTMLSEAWDELLAQWKQGMNIKTYEENL